jgi:hypothetical protein
MDFVIFMVMTSILSFLIDYKLLSILDILHVKAFFSCISIKQSTSHIEYYECLLYFESEFDLQFFMIFIKLFEFIHFL